MKKNSVNNLNVLDISNGEVLTYIDEGKGSTTLMLFHGIRGSSETMEPFIKELSKKYRVIVPDFRGSGHSSYYRKFFSIKDLTQDLVELVLNLELKSFYALTWSFGSGP